MADRCHGTMRGLIASYDYLISQPTDSVLLETLSAGELTPFRMKPYKSAAILSSVGELGAASGIS